MAVGSKRGQPVLAAVTMSVAPYWVRKQTWGAAVGQATTLHGPGSSVTAATALVEGGPPAVLNHTPTPAGFASGSQVFPEYLSVLRTRISLTIPGDTDPACTLPCCSQNPAQLPALSRF